MFHLKDYKDATWGMDFCASIAGAMSRYVCVQHILATLDVHIIHCIYAVVRTFKTFICTHVYTVYTLSSAIAWCIYTHMSAEYMSLS